MKLKTTLPTHAPPALQDVVLLLSRIGLGVVLIAHGWQKLDDQGIEGTAAGFEAMGVPFPEAAAHYATWVELVGGALLVVGLLTPLIGLLVAADMAGAFWYAHREGGVFVAEGGWALVAMIGLLGLTLAGVGAGRLSLDRWISGARAQDGALAPKRDTVDA
jgi:putative oxidoreductase